MSLVRDLQHVTVYRDPEGKWNGAFPEIVRLSALAPPSGPGGNGNPSTSRRAEALKAEGSGQALAVAFRYEYRNGGQMTLRGDVRRKENDRG